MGLVADAGFRSCWRFALVDAVQVDGDAMAAMTVLGSNAGIEAISWDSMFLVQSHT